MAATPGDAGTEGRFSDKAGRRFQWWLTRNRLAVWLVTAAVIALGVFAWKFIL